MINFNDVDHIKQLHDNVRDQEDIDSIINQYPIIKQQLEKLHNSEKMGSLAETIKDMIKSINNVLSRKD